VRTRVCERLAVLSVPAALADGDGDAVVAAPSDGPHVVVVTAREDAEMAREARTALER
jgi:hypothetical protein